MLSFITILALCTHQLKAPFIRQLYILNAAEATNIRLANPHKAECRPDIMAFIHDVLMDCNPLVAQA